MALMQHYTSAKGTGMAQIRRFGIWQTAKVLGVLYGFGGLLLVPIFAALVLMGGEEMQFGIAFTLLLPVFYGILGFIMTAIGAAIYNVVSGWIGGIEVEITDTAI